MRGIAFFFACLACVGHARRVQNSAEQLNSGPVAANVEPLKVSDAATDSKIISKGSASNWQTGIKRIPDPALALAMLFLAFIAVAAFEDRKPGGKLAPLGHCRVAIYCLLWWSSSLLVVMTIKETVSPGGVFPYSYTFTLLTQIAAGSLAWLLARFQACAATPLPPLQRKEVLYICLYGLMHGVEIALANKVLSYLTISGRTFLSSSSVFFMMISAWAWGLERLDHMRITAGVLLAVGGSMTVINAQPQASLASSQSLGMLMQVAAILVSAHRWVLAQFVMQKSAPESAFGQMSKLQFLALVMPLTGLVCLPFSLLFEGGAFTGNNFEDPDLFISVFKVSFGLIVMLSAELKLVQSLSAVAYSVLGTLHQIPIVLGGIYFNHEHVRALPTSGFSLCLAGALVYAQARAVDQGGAGAALAKIGYPLSKDSLSTKSEKSSSPNDSIITGTEKPSSPDEGLPA